MSILKKMKKKWYALNSHRIDEIEDQKAVEKLLKFAEELPKKGDIVFVTDDEDEEWIKSFFV